MIAYPDVKVVLVGDAMCKILEAGWEKEPRVICKSGEWTIRESISFAQVADIVVGPETGVLNAVSHDLVPKVVTLSHSSVENLTRDWVNVTSLTPKNVSCYPCHMMHYNWDNCRKHEDSGTAMCQFDISPEAMFAAIQDWIGETEWQHQAA
jgi:hypothetical protein